MRSEVGAAGAIATRWAGQPSRFLADRAEAERAFALAERLGSINAAAAELYAWVRRDEEYATLGANVVVELYSESHARRSTTRAWARSGEMAADAR